MAIRGRFLSFIAVLLALSSSQAIAAGYNCERHLLDRILDRTTARGSLSETVDLLPPSKKVRLIYELKPESFDVSEVPFTPKGRFFFMFGARNHELIENRVLDMARQGLRFEGSRYSAGQLRLEFIRDIRLIRELDRDGEPPWVALQREELRRRFPKARFHDRYHASKEERYYDDRPPNEMLLTSRTLQALPSGLHSFALLRGENFLRLGSGHHIIGAGELAQTAGDIMIWRDRFTGQNQVMFITPRSDTYRPSDDSLVHAVEALWSQNIFPRHFELREWNNKTVILSL